jgi:hypothetical protein
MNPPWFAIFVVSVAGLMAPLVIAFFSSSLNPIGWLVLIVTVLMAGCTTRTKVVLDDPMRQAAVDTAELQSSDGSIYQPAFRILEYRGRLRLIAQDPLTHHYVLVD